MKKWMQRFKKDERGLTLVELLAVIVILAIVGAIAFVSIGNVMENSRKDAHVANAQQLISAAKLYDASIKNIEKLTDSTVDLDTLQSEGLMGEFTNPWGDESYSGSVTKDVTGGVVTYIVTIEGTDIPTEININDVEESTINGGRDSVEEENATGDGES